MSKDEQVLEVSYGGDGVVSLRDYSLGPILRERESDALKEMGETDLQGTMSEVGQDL